MEQAGGGGNLAGHIPVRHARLYAGYPRPGSIAGFKTWMAGT